jgi:hypothetical protein
MNSTDEVTKYLTVYSDLPDIRLLITLNKDGDGPFVQMLSGRRLLVKILPDKPDKPITISFDIKGAYYARKLELE